MDIYGDKEAIGFVYVWLHRASGKYYIGSHCGAPDDGYIASGIRIQNAIKKYGIEAFTRTIDYIGPDFRQEETDLIAFFDACNCPLGYNISHIHNSGATFGLEHRAKLSAAKKGKGNVSAETRAKISTFNKNKIVSDETKAKMSTARSGKVVSEETRAKMRLAQRARRQTEATVSPI